MLVLVCGSRTWTDADAIERRLTALPATATVLHGHARTGADAIADKAARRLGLEVIRYPADWATFGRRAGIVRNRLMLGLNPALVIAFWDGTSTGTKDTIEEARRRGIAVEVHEQARSAA